MTALAEASVLSACRGEPTAFAVLVNGFADPVDAWVVADRIVLGIDTDDFEIFPERILVEPVRVEDTQVGGTAANPLLSEGAQVARGLDLVDAMVLWLSVNNALSRAGPALARPSADGDAEDSVSLLGLVSEPAGLVWASGVVHAADARQLAVLPCAHSQQEAEHIALLLLQIS